MEEVVQEASGARYHAAFDTTDDGLLVVDGTHRIVAANPKACRMHGYAPGELAGHLYTDLIADEWIAFYRNLRAHPETTGVVRMDKVHTRADGSRFDCEVRATWLRYESRADEILINIRDLGERHRAVQRLTQLSRTILMAQEEERARLARELHDQLGQILTAIRLELGCLHQAPRMSAERTRTIENCSLLVEQAADELRRVCRGLRPPALDDLGIVAAINHLARDVADHAPFTIHLDLDLDDEGLRLPPEAELCIYRVLQETLNNVLRHAHASQVHVRLACEGNDILLDARDNGQGFDLDETRGFRGIGIEGMHERASLVGGEIQIESSVGAGTRLLLRIPELAKQRGVQ